MQWFIWHFIQRKVCTWAFRSLANWNEITSTPSHTILCIEMRIIVPTISDATSSGNIIFWSCPITCMLNTKFFYSRRTFRLRSNNVAFIIANTSSITFVVGCKVKFPWRLKFYLGLNVAKRLSNALTYIQMAHYDLRID